MSMLQGCSELRETARLVDELLEGNRHLLRVAVRRAGQGGGAAPVAQAQAQAARPVPVAPTVMAAATPKRAVTPQASAIAAAAPNQAAAAVPDFDQTLASASAVVPPPSAGAIDEALKAPAAPISAPSESLGETPHLAYRGDRLEHVLASMCSRGGLSGAVVADGQGLPLADYQSPVGGDVLAAFTSVLGGALERAGLLLGAQAAETISMDLNYTDKVVLRRFGHEGVPYFILVICSQDLDERSEVELSIEQITSILTEN